MILGKTVGIFLLPDFSLLAMVGFSCSPQAFCHLLTHRESTDC